MSPSMEFEGKSIEKVTQKASKKLKIPLSDLKYDVISYGSSGIFGLVGTKKAKIRVSLPNTSLNTKPAPAVESTNETESRAIFPTPTENPHPPAVNAGKDVLQRILDEISGNATFSVEQNAEQISFDIQNDNAAIIFAW